MTDDRLARAKELYERAVFGGDSAATAEADDLIDGLEADLELARGRILHARFLDERQEDPREQQAFERAVELYQVRGDTRGEAESLFWLGTFHQVVRGDHDTALPLFERAYALAEQAGDRMTMSYAARHLGFVDAIAGRMTSARQRLEESVRLRREVGHLPGVAAGLLALARLAADDGREAELPALMAEATETAAASNAHGILAWIEEYRASLS